MQQGPVSGGFVPRRARAVEMIQHLACKPNRTQGWSGSGVAYLNTFLLDLFLKGTTIK